MRKPTSIYYVHHIQPTKLALDQDVPHTVHYLSVENATAAAKALAESILESYCDDDVSGHIQVSERGFNGLSTYVVEFKPFNANWSRLYDVIRVIESVLAD